MAEETIFRQANAKGCAGEAHNQRRHERNDAGESEKCFTAQFRAEICSRPLMFAYSPAPTKSCRCRRCGNEGWCVGVKSLRPQMAAYVVSGVNVQREQIPAGENVVVDAGGVVELNGPYERHVRETQEQMHALRKPRGAVPGIQPHRITCARHARYRKRMI